MILENYPQVRGEGGLMSLTRCKRSSPGTESRVGDQPGRLVFVVWGGLVSLTRCKRSSPGTESRVGDQPGRLVFVVWLSLAHPGRAPKSRASQ
jgi:hypothetical protein